MKTLIVAGLLCVTQCVSAQIKVAKLTKAAIPKFIKYKGIFVDAMRYTDKEGDHIIVTSDDEDVKTYYDDDPFRSEYLYAYDYKVQGNSATLVWQLYDFVESCQSAAIGDYSGNTTITDLDNNGIAEVWLTYKVGCDDAATSSTMKVIMHEGSKKYALRGRSHMKLNKTEYTGGTYTFDEVFNAGPQSFKDYALRLWKKYEDETNPWLNLTK